MSSSVELKLVRNAVPRMIQDEGGHPVSYQAGLVEYQVRLREKITDEVEEFLDSGYGADAIEKLADIVEVVSALAETLGCSLVDIEEIRKAKAAQFGGFSQRLVLVENR